MEPDLSLAAMFGLGAFATTAIAAAIIAAVVLHRNARLKDRITAMEAEHERLHDAIWEMRESEERYRSILEGQDDLILRRDQTGRLTYVNEAFALAAGRDRTELIGSVFVIPARETLPRGQGEDGSTVFDQAIVTARGLRWISWIETPVHGAHGMREVQSVGRDITDRREAEGALAEARAKAEAASEAKSRFLATVSHEIRTPLNGVLGMADLLMGTRIDAEQATYVKAVKTSGQALLSIIDEILDFSKIEAGKLELTCEPFDLAGLVEGTVELLAPRAQGKGIEIAGFIAGDVPRRVIGDAARLRQVLTNLAGNAVKFTDAGGVGISVSRLGDRVMVEIADTGVGIPPDRLTRIFEEFEQVDGSASSRHGGTGLGLAISKRLVAGMGGALSVISTPGQGSTFRFAIVLPTAPGTEDKGRPALSLAGRRAVIVSPSPFEAPFLARRMGEVGATVTVVDGPVAAQSLLASGPAPDFFIVDGAIGEDEAKILSVAAHRAGVTTRIILLSPFERRAFGPPSAAGFDFYLVKPVREHSLASRLGATPDAPPVLPEGAPAPVRRSAPSVDVLLAEDNDINALLATKLLERHGATVTWARNGLEAVEQFRLRQDAGTRFDLILMDVRMPGLDGHEAVRQIRDLERTNRLPRSFVVALTANAFAEDRQFALEAGMDSTLAKPVDEAALVQVLATAAGERHSSAA